MAFSINFNVTTSQQCTTVSFIISFFKSNTNAKTETTNRNIQLDFFVLFF